VSVAVFLRGALEGSDLVPYIVAQIVGASLASGALLLITGTTFATAPDADYRKLYVLVAEVLLTFALALVILNVATPKATEGDSF